MMMSNVGSKTLDYLCEFWKNLIKYSVEDPVFYTIALYRVDGIS